MLAEIRANDALVAWFFACIAAQSIKVVIGTMRLKRFDFHWLIGTGGMPSTHASGVTALSVVIGMEQGFHTPLFATAAAFTVITLFDAQGVRRWSGRQAQVLNKMLEDIYFKRRIQEERVKELLGHTPLEVLGGMVVGTLVALIIVARLDAP